MYSLSAYVGWDFMRKLRSWSYWDDWFFFYRLVCNDSRNEKKYLDQIRWCSYETGCKLRNCEQVWYFYTRLKLALMSWMNFNFIFFYLTWTTFPLTNHILLTNIKPIPTNSCFFLPWVIPMRTSCIYICIHMHCQMLPRSCMRNMWWFGVNFHSTNPFRQ